MSKHAELESIIAAVDEMAVKMKAKLREKAREGYSGGLTPSFRTVVAEKLIEHAETLTGTCPHCHSHDGEHDHEEGAEQAVDVCNLALMLWVQAGKP